MEKMYVCPICGKYHTLAALAACATQKQNEQVNERKNSMAIELGSLSASIKGDYQKLEEKIEKYNALARRFNEDFANINEEKYGTYVVSLTGFTPRATTESTVTVKNLPYIQEKKSEVARAIDEIFNF